MKQTGKDKLDGNIAVASISEREETVVDARKYWDAIDHDTDTFIDTVMVRLNPSGKAKGARDILGEDVIAAIGKSNNTKVLYIKPKAAAATAQRETRYSYA